jgi:hypothetical protein
VRPPYHRQALPAGVEAEDGCAGTVAVRVTRRGRTISHRGALTVRVRFGGNAILRPARARVRRVRGG